ncbi:MAG: FAD-dependent oxidoreductase [Actinobacteria bacterium]|nr:FAD-dependent oxidoreductase [Actinomycetota bacterium]
MEQGTVIIGGGPAGIITAVTARTVHPERPVTLVKEIGDGVIPCAIPYMVRSMDEPAQNRMGDLPLEKAGVEVVVGTVVGIDPDAHTIELADGATLPYARLVLATGTVPAKPPIDGVDLPGVYSIHKSMHAMAELREKALAAKHVVILGGGFIGAEFADELAGGDAEVHIVEMLPHLLQTAFDDEFCDQIRIVLEKAGVIVHTDTLASRITGTDAVESVVLSDGTELPADMVVLGVGGRPSIELAEQAGLRITDRGSIWVDDYMRTSVPDVLAVGDCALKRDFFTRREAPVWLASTATAEARIAAYNLYEIKVVRQIAGTIAAFSTQLGGVAFASAGLTCRTAQAEGFSYVCRQAAAPDRHPGSLEGATEMQVRLVFDKSSGTLLGGQAMGGPSVGELINVIAVGIQMKITVAELDMLQIATHPLLTPAPTVHPLINAAHMTIADM